MTTPRKPTLDPEGLGWTQFHIVTEDQTETSCGAIEEAMQAVNGAEIVLAARRILRRRWRGGPDRSPYEGAE